MLQRSMFPGIPTTITGFPPLRACIFDVDGLLIDSEDIYTEAYNSILHEYGKPDYPWSVKARQQSRGREVIPYHAGEDQKIETEILG